MRFAPVITSFVVVVALAAPALAQSPSPPPSAASSATPAPSPAASAVPSATAQPAPSPSARPTPTDTATVTAPAGWQPGAIVQSGPFTILHLWRPPARQGRPDNLVLGYVPLGAAQGTDSVQYGKAVADAVRKMGPPGNVKQSKAMKVCRGTQQGWFVEDVLNFGTLKVRQESVLVAGPHEGFMAAYTRKEGDRAIRAAESAIKTLCVK